MIFLNRTISKWKKSLTFPKDSMKILSTIFFKGSLYHSGGSGYCSSRKSARSRLSDKKWSSYINAGTLPAGKMFKYHSGLSDRLIKTVSCLRKYTYVDYRRTEREKMKNPNNGCGLSVRSASSQYSLDALGVQHQLSPLGVRTVSHRVETQGARHLGRFDGACETEEDENTLNAKARNQTDNGRIAVGGTYLGPSVW